MKVRESLNIVSYYNMNELFSEKRVSLKLIAIISVLISHNLDYTSNEIDPYAQ